MLVTLWKLHICMYFSTCFCITQSSSSSAAAAASQFRPGWLVPLSFAQTSSFDIIPLSCVILYDTVVLSWEQFDFKFHRIIFRIIYVMYMINHKHFIFLVCFLQLLWEYTSSFVSVECLLKCLRLAVHSSVCVKSQGRTKRIRLNFTLQKFTRTENWNFNFLLDRTTLMATLHKRNNTFSLFQ
jgi:predicted ferric reductase